MKKSADETQGWVLVRTPISISSQSYSDVTIAVFDLLDETYFVFFAAIFAAV
jgi:siderophore synthetase component